MKTLSTGQDALARRAHLVPINLVKITNHAETATWYLSDRAVSYDYEGAGAIDFLPWVKAFGRLPRGMSHLSDPGGGDLVGGLSGNSGRVEWRLALSNELWEGERIAETLDAEDLEGATIEWAQVMIDASQDSYPIDLSDWANTDKAVMFRGKVRQVGPITEEAIELSCSVDLPSIDWSYNNSATAASEDLGIRVPIPIGAAQKVACLHWEKGGQISTVLTIWDAPAAVLYVESHAAFPSSGVVRIDDELIAYGSKQTWGSGTGSRGEFTLESLTHGYGGTQQSSHENGSIVSLVDMEAPELWIAGEGSPSAIDAVYAKTGIPGVYAPLIESLHYTVDLADTTTISGKTLATISVLPSQIQTIRYRTKIAGLGPYDDMSTAGATQDWPEVSVTTNSEQGGSDANIVDDDDLTSRTMRNDDYCIIEYPEIATEPTLSSLYLRYRARQWDVVIETDLPGAGYGTSNIRYYIGPTSSGPWHELFGRHSATEFSKTTKVPDEGMEIGLGEHYRFFKIQGDQTAGTNDYNIFEVTCTLLFYKADTGAYTSRASTTERLEIVADVSGPVVPGGEGGGGSGNYKAADAALIEHPADVFRHFVETIASEACDETSLVAAHTNLGSNKLAFDARALGLSWAQIAVRIGYESRANVVRLEKSTGSEWAFLTAGTTYTYAAPTLAVSTWEPGGIAMLGRDELLDLFTRFVFYYGFDTTEGSFSVEGYSGFLRVSPSDNDISAKVATGDLTAAEAAYGAIESAPIAFLCIQDGATAIDVAGYLVHEIIRRAKLFAIKGVPWYDGEAYALELGDMRNVTPPWSSTAVKCRVIEIVKDETEQLELRLVEVE